MFCHLLNLDQKTLAINFVDEFYKNVYRGFDPASIDIFAKLKYTNFEDVLLPAKETLNLDSGENSCAMYIAPIALFCTKDDTLNLNDQIRKATALTHLHEMAVNGAILQANAINILVKTAEKLNVDDFLDQIIDSIRANNQSTNNNPSFEEQLNGVKKLLNVPNPSEERVVNALGHSSQALYSVPTAIYCFLRGVKYQNDVGLVLIRKKIIAKFSILMHHKPSTK